MNWLTGLVGRLAALFGLFLAGKSAGKEKAKRKQAEENVKRTRRAKTARDSMRARRGTKRVRRHQRD